MTIEGNDIRELTADILVIGGGGAGDTAATAAPARSDVVRDLVVESK